MRSSDSEKLFFGGASFSLKGVEYKNNMVEYSNIKMVHYYNIRHSINGMPMTHDFSIKIKLWEGKSIKLKESTNIQPAITKIPISKIFSSGARRNKKQEISQKIEEIKIRFVYSLTLIKEMSGVEPQEKLPWF